MKRHTETEDCFETEKAEFAIMHLQTKESQDSHKYQKPERSKERLYPRAIRKSKALPPELRDHKFFFSPVLGNCMASEETNTMGNQ